MSTPGSRAKLAALFMKAARRMDKPMHKYGCCRALSDVQLQAPGAGSYTSAAHEVFRDVFDWFVAADVKEWHALDSYGRSLGCYPEDMRQARVLALLFCAEMARRGEIG